MLVLRVVGGIMIVSSGLLASRFFGSEEDRKIERTDAFRDFLFAVRGRIESFCMPLSEILSDIDGDIFLRLGYKSDELPKNFEKMSENCPFFADEELSLLFRAFALSIGNGYRNEEIGRCENCILETEKLLEKRKNERQQKKKTVPVLAMAISLGIAVLLF